VSGLQISCAKRNINDVMTKDAESLPAENEPEKRFRADPRLLELLVCPLTRANLIYDADRQELISRAAKLAYPIRDGVPIMLPEEARKLDD
jgi:hypothetical protein